MYDVLVGESRMRYDKGQRAASRADFSGGGEAGFVLGVAAPFRFSRRENGR